LASLHLAGVSDLGLKYDFTFSSIEHNDLSILELK